MIRIKKRLLICCMPLFALSLSSSADFPLPPNLNNNNNNNLVPLDHAFSEYGEPITPTAIQADPSISIDFLTGKFSPAKQPNFVKIHKRYGNSGLYLQKEAYNAFKQMHKAARKAGIKLNIRSATRNFYKQKTIWDGKWQGKRRVTGVKNIRREFPNPVSRALKILEYSSMPGSSRHHWGTDIDLNAFNNRYFEKGYGKKVYQWLQTNAGQYGFCQPYTHKDSTRPNGYNEEKWHWSYLPLARHYTEQTSIRVGDDMIQGFKGDNTPMQIGIVHNYMLGINPECR